MERHNPAKSESQDTPQSAKPEYAQRLGQYVKSLLHLPVQTTNAMLYARTRKDGLGTTCLEDAVLDLTIRGLRKLCRKNKSETIRGWHEDSA